MPFWNSLINLEKDFEKLLFFSNILHSHFELGENEVWRFKKIQSSPIRSSPHNYLFWAWTIIFDLPDTYLSFEIYFLKPFCILKNLMFFSHPRALALLAAKYILTFLVLLLSLTRGENKQALHLRTVSWFGWTLQLVKSQL